MLTEQAVGRSLLRKIGPRPGEGPSEKSRHAGFYHGRLIAYEKDRPRLLLKMEAKGDPGNELTVLFATETARLLHEGKAKAGGISTVSQAFGNSLIQRLEAEGVKFSSQTLD
jgi:short subunit dehydrogenase-like uncharacterized protein